MPVRCEKTRPISRSGNCYGTWQPISQQPGSRSSTGEATQVRINALTRVLRNLIENALTYSGEKAVTLNWSAADETLFIRVTDHGPGIPEPERENIFQPFYRLETSRNRSTGGSGLGRRSCSSFSMQTAGALPSPPPATAPAAYSKYGCLGLRIAADAPTYGFQLRARSFSTTRCLNQPETFSHHAEIREKHSLAKV